MIQSLSSIYLTVKDHLKGGRKTHLEIDKHISNKSNPHQISKSQIESVLTGTITSHSHTTSGLSDTIEFTAIITARYNLILAPAAERYK